MILDKINGTAERLEILTEDINLHSVASSKTKTRKQGTVTSAVYDYSIKVVTSRSTPKSYSKEEIVYAKNAVSALFVKHGERCLDEKFLTEKLQAEYPELDIESVELEYVYKHFKEMGYGADVDSVWTSKDLLLLDSQKIDTDNVSI